MKAIPESRLQHLWFSSILSCVSWSRHFECTVKPGVYVRSDRVDERDRAGAVEQCGHGGPMGEIGGGFALAAVAQARGTTLTLVTAGALLIVTGAMVARADRVPRAADERGRLTATWHALDCWLA